VTEKPDRLRLSAAANRRLQQGAREQCGAGLCWDGERLRWYMVV